MILKPRKQLKKMAGVSLIELLIASIVSVVVILGVLEIYINSQNSSRTQSLIRQIQENGRFAMQIIGEDVRMAKYYGLNIRPSTIDKSDVDKLTHQYGCGGTAWATAISQPIFVSNNSNPYRSSCISDASYKAGTDVLVVRRTHSNPVNLSGIKSRHLYLYTSLTDGEIFRAENKGAVNASTLSNVVESPAYIYRFSTNVYYIRPCTNIRGAICSDNIPTLVRQSLSADRTYTEPVVQYIENFQITLGIDISSPSDNIVDRYASPEHVPDWDDVISARIALLVRSPETVGGYINTNTYHLGEEVIIFNDGYHRKVFSETLFLRNKALETAEISI